MFGLYIKRRGWIKDARKLDFTCCRNPSDIHKDFLFKDQNEFTAIKATYDWMFERLDKQEVQYTYTEIPEDLRLDKRVIPHKKHNKNSWHNKSPEFDVVSAEHSPYTEFCSYCQLLIKPDEAVTEDGICIHCLKVIKDSLDKIYNEMDDEIKRAWERARLIDEI